MDRQESFELLVEKARTLKRLPTWQEVKDDENLPEPNEYAINHGSFDKALEKVAEAVGEEIGLSTTTRIVRRIPPKAESPQDETPRNAPSDSELDIDRVIKAAAEAGVEVEIEAIAKTKVKDKADLPELEWKSLGEFTFKDIFVATYTSKFGRGMVKILFDNETTRYEVNKDSTMTEISIIH